MWQGFYEERGEASFIRMNYLDTMINSLWIMELNVYETIE
jgi:hypothetical protein